MGASRNFRPLLVAALVFFLARNVSAELPQGGGAQTKVVVLSEAARHFGVSVSWKTDEAKLLLTHGDTRVQILIGSNRVLINEYVLALSAPVRAQDGAVTVPLTDAAAIFSHLLDRHVSEAEFVTNGLAGMPLSSAEGKILVDNVRYISYPRFTRLIISLKNVNNVETVEIQTSEEGSDLVFILPNSRFLQHQAPVDINDGTVVRLEFLQEARSAKLLVKKSIDKVTSDLQKYNDPPRIVIDVRPDEPVAVTPFQQTSLMPPSNGILEHEPERRPEQSLTTVVIDPGHGGKDVGARGKGGLLEKDVALDVALRLKELVERKTDIKVVLTRNTDAFISLEERTIIANCAKDGGPADLFISVHTNSHKSPKVDGFEAYYISDKVDPGAEATAALENAVVNLEREGNAQADPVTPILWDLQFTEFISESSELAFIAEKELSGRLNTRDRGVRQAKFIVLAGVAMPSVLIEMGYISNRVEESKMKTAEFKERCAEGLAEVVFSFKKRRDTRLGLSSRGN